MLRVVQDLRALAEHNGNGQGNMSGPQMADLVLGQHTVDFFLGLTLCQQLIVEDSPEGPDHPAVYQVRQACCALTAAAASSA